MFFQKVCSAENVKKLLAEWIISDDLPFTVVESPFFRRLVKLLNPEIKLVGADAIQATVMEMFETMRDEIKRIFQVNLLK